MAIVWSSELEVAFISAFQAAARRPHFVAAGGKNLRAAGWHWVLQELKDKIDGLTTVGQLQSKWKRCKTDWADFHYLKNLSGFGTNWDPVKWAEVDAQYGQ